MKTQKAKQQQQQQQNEDELAWKVDIWTRKKFLAVDNACMAIFRPAQGFKGINNIDQLRALTRRLCKLSLGKNVLRLTTGSQEVIRTCFCLLTLMFPKARNIYTPSYSDSHRVSGSDVIKPDTHKHSEGAGPSLRSTLSVLHSGSDPFHEPIGGPLG